MGFKFLTSLLFVVTEEVDAEKNEVNKKKKKVKNLQGAISERGVGII